MNDIGIGLISIFFEHANAFIVKTNEIRRIFVFISKSTLIIKNSTGNPVEFKARLLVAFHAGLDQSIFLVAVVKPEVYSPDVHTVTHLATFGTTLVPIDES